MGDNPAIIIDKLSILIPIWHRISEILDERGISLNAFSQRIRMGKDTFYKCLSGRRYIKPSELHRIAEVFKLTVDRIRQDDTQKLALELRSLELNKSNMKRAVWIANELRTTLLMWSTRLEWELGSIEEPVRNADRYTFAI